MDSQWLKQQFERHPGKSKASLAKFLGVVPPAISKILADQRQIKASEYILMRQFFGYPVDIPMESGVLLPERMASQGMGEKTHIFNIEDQDSVSQPIFSSPNVSVFTIKDASMAPDFMPGDAVLIDLSETRPDPAGVFLVKMESGPTLRQCRVIPKSKPLTIEIKSLADGASPIKLPARKAGLIGRASGKIDWF